MPFEFYRFNDKLPSHGTLSLLVFGGSGCGKTFFAGTAGSRTLYVDCGNGTLTLDSPLFRSKVRDFNPLMLKITENMEADRSVSRPEGFDHVCDGIDEALEKHSSEFDTVVLDDLTAMQKFAIHKALTTNNEEGRSRTATKKRKVILPAMQDYGTEMSMINWFLFQYIDILKEAGKHFIVLAHDRYTFKKKDKVMDPDVVDSIRPKVTGKAFPDEVMAPFDFVWHAEKAGSGKDAVYRFRIYGDEEVRGKTRFGGVFDSLEMNPNFLKMVERIRNVK